MSYDCAVSNLHAFIHGMPNGRCAFLFAEVFSFTSTCSLHENNSHLRVIRSGGHVLMLPSPTKNLGALSLRFLGGCIFQSTITGLARICTGSKAWMSCKTPGDPSLPSWGVTG